MRFLSFAVTWLAVLFLAPTLAAGQIPRTPDGKPNLQGYWEAEIQGTYSIEDLELQNIFQRTVQGRPFDEGRQGRSRIIDPVDGRIPYQSWAVAKRDEVFANHTNPSPDQVDPQARCFLTGVPRAMYQPTQYQIIQPGGYVVILYELNHSFRTIPLDGRPHVGGNVKLWMGDSRGRWEGDTLIVDTTNFNGKMWFDMIGDFQSDTMHIVERFTLVGADRINYEVTVEDSNLYTRPWKLSIPIVRVKEKGFEIIEYACHEGERDLQHIQRR